MRYEVVEDVGQLSTFVYDYQDCCLLVHMTDDITGRGDSLEKIGSGYYRVLRRDCSYVQAVEDVKCRVQLSERVSKAFDKAFSYGVNAKRICRELDKRLG